MRLADIDFSDKTAMFYRGNLPCHLDHYTICRDEYDFLRELCNGAGTESYLIIACGYYRKLVVYLNIFKQHMPDSLRITLLQEIKDSVDG